MAKEESKEFGGPIGVLALMIWSHYILYYFYYCYQCNNGNMIIPGYSNNNTLYQEILNFIDVFKQYCIPSVNVWIAYAFFFIMQLVLAAFVPGMLMYGVKIDKNGTRLPYLCNGYLCYYIFIYLLFTLHYNGIYKITDIVDYWGEYLTAAVVVGDVTSLLWYIYGLHTATPAEKAELSGNHIYDFFMGSILYPRFGIVDIKMIAEARWSWLTLMLLTGACAVKQYEENGGYITKEMGLMVLAHWLYSNATVKGEHCIPGTWDMFHEKFGWMLNFWNVAGVPYLYCFQSYYLYKNQSVKHVGNETISNSVLFTIFTYILLLVSYYIFDTANSQKASFRLPGIARKTFPQVPWAVLQHPVRVINIPGGGVLIIDGWYAFVRKAQYTGDILMALSWGLATGLPLKAFSIKAPYLNLLNYFYCIFFTCMIIHRQSRDEIRCGAKYGVYWDVYTKEVPNVFLPGPKFFKWLFSSDKSLPPFDVDQKIAEIQRGRSPSISKSDPSKKSKSPKRSVTPKKR